MLRLVALINVNDLVSNYNLIRTSSGEIQIMCTGHFHSMIPPLSLSMLTVSGKTLDNLHALPNQSITISQRQTQKAVFLKTNISSI